MRWLHIHAKAGERIERLQHIEVDLFIPREFICKKRRRGLPGFQKRQRMFADTKIPIRMTYPLHVEFILKPEGKVDIFSSQQLIEYYAIINPLDGRGRSVAIVKSFA